MGYRFRKSINLGAGVKLNVSKKGLGVSAGVKGLRVSHGADGKIRVTASAPGTGLSYQETLNKSSNSTMQAFSKMESPSNKPINVISQEERLQSGFDQDYFLSFHGQLEQCYKDGERDSYYEKYANVYIYKDHIEVTYVDPNTAAFVMLTDGIKLYKVMDQKRFLFSKKTIPKLRIQNDSVFGTTDLTFTLQDEQTVDDIIAKYNSVMRG